MTPGTSETQLLTPHVGLEAAKDFLYQQLCTTHTHGNNGAHTPHSAGGSVHAYQ